MWGIQKKLLIGLISVLVALSILGATVFRNIRKSIKVDSQILQSHSLIEEIEATRSLLKDIEVAKYGYVATGNESYLQSYQTAINGIEDQISYVKTLTKSAEQQDRIKHLEPMILQEIRLSERIIDLRREKGFIAAKELINTSQNEQEVNAIQGLFFQIENTERELLKSLRQKSEKSDSNSFLTVLSLIFTILGLSILSLLLTKNYLSKRSELEARLNEIATHDELTGLYNRREANRLLRREIEQFHRTHRVFSFALLDIDNFKSVNDTYGHQIGDEVIRWIAHQIRSNVRSTDFPARFGGEEFSILLPESSLDDAFSIAERIRQAIASNPFETVYQNNQPVQLVVTISAGISIFAQVSKTEADLICEADQALYCAKDEGRNRCIVFTSII